MRALIAALVVTFAIAVTASVFAIWPVVGDAPWEDDEQTGNAVLCEAALELRQTSLQLMLGTSSAYDRETASNWLTFAGAEVKRYC